MKKYDLRAVDRFIHREVLRHPGGMVPKYTKDVSWFFEIQTALSSWGFCCINLYCDFDYRYGVKLTHESNHSKVFEREEDEPMPALCFCAMKAYEKDIPIKTVRPQGSRRQSPKSRPRS
jgi:hypothetical protein